MSCSLFTVQILWNVEMTLDAKHVCLWLNDAATAAAASEVEWEWWVWKVFKSFLLESQADVGSEDNRWQTGKL